MPPSQRITIRLSPPVADSSAATMAATADTLAAINARLTSIELRLAALEATTVPQQPQSRPRPPAGRRPTDMAPMTATPADTADTIPVPPAAIATMADTTTLGYDPAKYSLGLLCPRKHAYQQTGKTLRRLPRHVCPQCDAELQRERRKVKREGERSA